MGLLGDLLSIPVNWANVPLKVIDKVICEDGDSAMSAPLDLVSKELKKIDD